MLKWIRKIFIKHTNVLYVWKKNETQQHIYVCNEIFKVSGRKKENCPMYEKILNGNRRDEIEVAKIFKENMKIIEIYKQQNNQDWQLNLLSEDQVTDENPVCSRTILLIGNIFIYLFIELAIASYS